MALFWVILILFTGPLVDYFLFRINRTFNGALTVRDARLGLGVVYLEGVELRSHRAGVIFDAPRASVRLHPLRLVARRDWLALLGDMEVVGPNLRVHIDRAGTLNLATLPPPPRPGARPWSNRLQARLRVRDGWIHYQDDRRGGFLYQLKEWNGIMRLVPGQHAPFDFTFSPQDGSGRYHLYGQMDTLRPYIDLDLDMARVDAFPLAQHPAARGRLLLHEGQLTGSFWAQGGADRWRDLPDNLAYGARARLTGGELGLRPLPWPFRKVEAELQLLRGVLRVEQARALLNEMPVRLSGDVLFEKQSLNLSLTMPRVHLEQLQGLLKEPPDIRGPIALEARIFGELRLPVMEGRLQAARLEAGKGVFRDAALRFRVDSRSLWLQEARARSGRADLAAEGFVLLGPDRQLLLHLQGDRARLAEVVPGLAATADFDLWLLGSPGRPLVLGQGALSQMALADLPVEALRGRVLYDGSSLVLSQGQAVSRGVTVGVPLLFYDPHSSFLAAHLEARGYPVPAFQVKGLGSVEGDFSGSVLVMRSPDLPGGLAACGLLQGSRLVVRELAFDDLSGPFSFWKGRFFLPEVTGQTAGGQMRLAGSIDTTRQGRTSLSFQGLGVDRAVLAAALPFALPVDLAGRGEVLASLSGGGDRPLGYGAYTRGGASRAAASGFWEPGGRLGVLAWAEGFPTSEVRFLKGLPRPALHSVFTGSLGVAGPRGQRFFLYNGYLAGPGLGTPQIAALGQGRLEGRRLTLEDNLLAWPGAFQPEAVHLSGQAYPWVGPVESPPLVATPSSSAPAAGQTSMLAFSGTVDLASRRLDLDYAATNVDLAWFAERGWLAGGRSLEDLLGVDVQGGVLSSTGTVEGTTVHPVVRGQIRVPWLALGLAEGRQQVYSGAGRLKAEPDELAFEPLYLSDHPFDPRFPLDPRRPLPRLAGADLFALQGRLFRTARGPRLDLRVSGQGLTFQDALAFFPQTFRSSLAGVSGDLNVPDLRLWGPVVRPSLAGRLELSEGVFQSGGRYLPLGRLSATLSSAAGQVRLSHLSLEAGALRLRGSGVRDASGRLVADLAGADLPLSYFHTLGAPFTGLEGRADAALHLESTGQGLRAYLGLEGRGLRWNPWIFTGHQGTPLDLEAVTFGRVRRQADGSLATGPGLGIEVSLAADRLDLSIPPEGFRLVLDGARPSVLEARGGMSLGPWAAEQDLQDWFSSPQGPDFDHFQLSADHLRLSQLQRLLGQPASEREFQVSGTLAMQGQWYRDHLLGAPAPAAHYSLALSDFELFSLAGGQDVGLRLEGPLQASYQRQGEYGVLHLDPFRMSAYGAGLAGGSLQGSADLVLTQAPGSEPPASRLWLQGQEVGLEALRWLLPGRFWPSGTLESLELTAGGPLLMPELTAVFQISGGSLGPLRVASFGGALRGTRADGSYRLTLEGPGGGPFELYFGEARTAGQKLTLEGSIPLLWETVASPPAGRLSAVWEGRRLSNVEEMDVTATLTDNDLGLLEAFVPGVSRADGRMIASLRLGGTLAAPEVTGDFKVQKGQVASRWFGPEVRDLDVDLEFEQIPLAQARVVPGVPQPPGEVRHRYTIEKFSGRLGDRTFAVSGFAEMAGGDPTFIDVKIQGQGLPFRLGELFEGRADLDLALKGLPGRVEGRPEVTLVPTFTGQIRIPQGDLTVPLGGAEELVGAGQAAPFPIRYQVDLSLGDDVWVHFFGSRVKAQGNLTVLPDPDTERPVLAGEVFLSRGLFNVPLTDLSFNLRQGTAYFNRSLNPTFEGVEADAVVGGYTITAMVNGSYPDLKVEYYSSPPLSQTEIRRLLVTGSPGTPGTLGSHTTELGAGWLASRGVMALSSLLATPITQQIGRLLVLSEVSFDYLPPATYTVKLAKALDARDRFLFTFTRVLRGGVGQDENLYGVEWRFQPGWLVRAAVDDLGGLRYWIQGFWDWH